GSAPGPASASPARGCHPRGLGACLLRRWSCGISPRCERGLAMRVLVTGHRGYIGSVLVPSLRIARVDVVGVDSELVAHCTFGDAPPDGPALRMDVRDISGSDLRGF